MKLDKFDQILVVDLECTCDDPQPPGFVQEVIEVGACLLNTTTYEVTCPTSILVVPTIGSVSDFCTRLTTITPSMVTFENGAVSFAMACEQLDADPLLAKQRAWASWGDFDRTTMETQSAKEGVVYPFGLTHFNVRALSRLVFGEGRASKGAKQAAETIGVEWTGTHHRGIDDALNIAKIFAAILRKARS